MKKPLLSALALAMALPTVSTPAAAQTTRAEHRERIADIRAECRDDRLRAMSARQRERARRECQRELRQARRDWRQYRQYDYNRYEPGYNQYYADRYYRDGQYYSERRLSRNDRIYRGQNGRYYCRRPDGTTGLIVGGAVGALLGNALDNGRSSLLGTLIGGGVGAALGREIQRGSVRCR